jgi:DNA-binding protein HU-beta
VPYIRFAARLPTAAQVSRGFGVQVNDGDPAGSAVARIRGMRAGVFNGISQESPVTLRQMAAELAESHDLPRKQAEAVLGDLMVQAARHLKNGDKTRLTGLGILQVRIGPARMGGNPGTGETIEIKASKKIAFRTAKELKESV